MIRATIQLYNENDPDGNPFTRDFDSREEMYKWWNSNTGHPWLSYSIIKTEEINHE